MTTIKDKLHFYYGGISSKTFGVVNAELNKGMFEETFVGNFTADYTYDSKRRTMLVSGIKSEPRSFDLTLVFEDGFTDEKLTGVINWLYKGYFSPLYFEGNENRIFYCMPNGEAKITHTGDGQGYLTVTMLTNSPYVFGMKKTIDLIGGVRKTISYDGLPSPELKISFTPNSDIVRINKDNELVEIRGLLSGEKIEIYPIDEDIISNYPDVYRHNNLVGDLTDLIIKKGENNFTITNATNIKIEYQPYYMR